MLLLLVAAVLADYLEHLLSNLLQVHTQALEYARSDTFALADEAEEQVLSPDVMVVESTCFIDRQLDDLLRARREANLTNDHRIATPDDELNGAANFRKLNAHVRQNAGGDSITLPNEAKEKVLGPNIVVIEAVRFLLSQRQDFARALCEPVEGALEHVSPPAGA